MARLWSGGGGRSSSLGTVKKVLLSLLVVGLLGTVTGRGVQAALNGESTHTGSSASNGTFTATATIKGQANGCHTETAASTDNKNVACPTTTGLLFTGTTIRWPGSGAAGDYVALSVQNTGSIDAQSLELAMTCTNGNKASSQTTTAVANLPGTEGTGSPCGVLATDNALEFYVQETSTLDGSNTTNGCLYPDTSSPKVPGQGNATDCTTQWTVNSLRTFRTKACWDLGRITAGQTRYFKIGTRFPPDSDNTYQGTQAFWTLKWHMVSNDPLYTPGCANDS